MRGTVRFPWWRLVLGSAACAAGLWLLLVLFALLLEG